MISIPIILPFGGTMEFGNAIYWGLHTDLHVEKFLLEKSFVGLGWTDIGDLSGLEDREPFKERSYRQSSQRVSLWFLG